MQDNTRRKGCLKQKIMPAATPKPRLVPQVPKKSILLIYNKLSPFAVQKTKIGEKSSEKLFYYKKACMIEEKLLHLRTEYTN